MDMGRKLTVLWNEGELGNSVMLSTCFCCRAVLPNVPYRLNAQFGHLVQFVIGASSERMLELVLREKVFVYTLLCTKMRFTQIFLPSR